jgi:hypothetical protein
MLAHEKGRDLFGRLRHGLGKQAFAIVVSRSGRRLVGLWRLSFFLFFCPFLFFLEDMMGTRRKRETQAKCI